MRELKKAGCSICLRWGCISCGWGQCTIRRLTPSVGPVAVAEGWRRRGAHELGNGPLLIWAQSPAETTAWLARNGSFRYLWWRCQQPVRLFGRRVKHRGSLWGGEFILRWNERLRFTELDAWFQQPGLFTRGVPIRSKEKCWDMSEGLLRMLENLGDLSHPPSMEAALGSLLQGRTDYFEPSSPVSLAHYNLELISLPSSS